MLLLFWPHNGRRRQIGAAETVLTNKKASGPYFTRKRFEKLQDEERAREEARLRALEAQKQLELEKAVDAVRDRAGEQVARLLQQANRVAQQRQISALPGKVEVVDYSQFAKHHQDMDEDDAIALLLLSGE